jgi:hypothetical protein
VNHIEGFNPCLNAIKEYKCNTNQENGIALKPLALKNHDPGNLTKAQKKNKHRIGNPEYGVVLRYRIEPNIIDEPNCYSQKAYQYILNRPAVIPSIELI